jgi:hypothetical protein
VGDYPFSSPSLQLITATPETGFALVNGTPVILSWTAPNDGNLHRFCVFARLIVTSNMTGGLVFISNAGTPLTGGTTGSGTAPWNNSKGAGDYFLTKDGASDFKGILGPAETVQIQQIDALTGGAGTVWAEIWGS